MRIISPLLKRVVYPSLAKAGAFRHKPADGLSIVTYHGIIPRDYEPVDPTIDGSLVKAETFRFQLRLLKKNYNVISPDQLLHWCENECNLPPRAVLVTCDDGLLNAATEMLPILQEQKVSCLFFALGLSASDSPGMLRYEELYLMLLAAPAGAFSVALNGLEIVGDLGTGEQRRALWRQLLRFLFKCDCEGSSQFMELMRLKLGLGANWKAAYLGDTARIRRFSLMSANELRVLLSAGMAIGAHTLSHPMLSQLPAEKAKFEIAEGRKRLETALRAPIWAFAYPFGGSDSVSSRELVMAQEAGFKSAFLSFGGGFGADLPRYALPRIHVTSEMNLAEFEAHVSGFHNSLQRKLGRIPRIA